MSPKPQHYDFANQLLASKDFFDRSTRVLDEADSGFRPKPDMMTVAQQVAQRLGKAVAVSRSKDGTPVAGAEQDLLAIPYYAWAHRGAGQMAVWLAREIRAAGGTGVSPGRK